MKNKIRLASLFALVALLTGCGTLGNPITGTPTVHSYVVTNTVPVVTITTNEVPGLPPEIVTLTNLIEQIETITETNTVFAVSTNWVNAIGTARGINGIANPSPSGPLVELGLAGLLAGMSWFARIKTNRAKGAEDLVKTLIAGVEKTKDPIVKATIQAESVLRGTGAALHAAVNP